VLAETEFPVPEGLYSRYTYSSWNGSASRWFDIVGGDNNAAGWNIFQECATGANGAAGKICELRGTTRGELYFGDSALPPVFTMCSVTRYAGYFKGRILAGPGNFAHGHYGGYVGVAEYGYTLMSDWRNKSLAFDTDWLIFCGQNAAPWRFFANGQSVGIVDSEPPMRTESRLGVNHCEYWNGWYCDYLNTDFGIMEIAIWNRTLSQDEILTMHMFYSDMLAHGNTGEISMRI
jgi:hypothetical protein